MSEAEECRKEATPEEIQAALDARMRGDPDPAAAPQQPWWYLLLAGLFLLGFAGLAGMSSIGIAIGCGIAGLIALFVANQTRLKQVAAARAERTGTSSFAAKRPPQMPYWIAPLVSLLPLGTAVEYGRDGEWFSALLTGAFGVLFLFIGMAGMWQQRQTRRVAGVMASALAPAPPAAEARTADVDGPRFAPPARVEIIASRTLPPAILPNDLPTPERNVAGQPPLSLLYLYNFYSHHTLLTKLDGSWCRYGPVFFLGSPADLGQGQMFTRDIENLAETELITSPAAFDARFDSLRNDLLRAGDPALKSYSHYTGGWPQHRFLCTDASWRHGVERLFAAADIVIMDASAYLVERGGLNWEIEQLLNQVDATDLLLLADDEADLIALRQAFEHAWAKMRSDSPNNRPDAGPVRIIVYPGDSKARAVEQDALAPGPPPDPTGRIALSSVLKRELLRGAFLRSCEHDRAMALLLAGRRQTASAVFTPHDRPR